MTISVEKRKAAMERVLVRLAEMFWDAPRGQFGDADLVGTSPLETTIAEMIGQGYVEETMFESNPQPYLLTQSGWYAALHIAGKLDSDEFDTRRGQLCAALKDAVKGRRDEAILDCREVARQANLPEGWVLNVLEGQTLYVVDMPKRRYWLRFEDGFVFVPATFGQEEVRL
jgi:hypothetical protein